MNAFRISIDGQEVEMGEGQSVLEGARKAGIAIPTLCYLEKCGPLNTCQICLVKIVSPGAARLAPSCGTKAVPGMVVESETVEVHEARRTALELLLSDHVGDCLSPCQRLCPLLLNIPMMIRQIETGRLELATLTLRDALPLPSVLGRLCHHPCEQGCRRGTWDGPAAIRDMERFVTDEEAKAIQRQAADHGVAPYGVKEPLPMNLPSRREPPLPGPLLHKPVEEREMQSRSLSSAQGYVPTCQPRSGKSVAIVGAGPVGLSAALYLARHGHAVTVVDRGGRAGGTLCDVAEAELPAEALDREIKVLGRMGVEFKLGLELGNHLTVPGLLRGFDAVLLAVGEIQAGEGERIGVAMTGASIKTDPNTCRTSMARVFAAGSAVKPAKQLVRVMTEGRAAAACAHKFLLDHPVHRPEKPFSSMMGRLNPGELRQFLRSASPSASVAPCDRCAGLRKGEAAEEAARCLHCECGSSGHCALQHYAQVYEADANRFKSERRPFEQHLQPGGIIFEPGKCIVCGICVKLTELAREPLGLAFVGRGFDVRVAAPFDREIEEGLRIVAAECVEHCPTGALVFAKKELATTSAETGSATERQKKC
jgi:NADPH-dependent glutamate synthase beta subunit-like oxidoreductase/ferredoxin